MNQPNTAEFVIHPTTDHQFRFLLRAANREIVLTSETYTTKASAKNGIEAVRVAARTESNFHKRTSTAKEPYFVLVAANHEVLGASEMYSSTNARNEGIAACQRAARDAIEREA